MGIEESKEKLINQFIKNPSYFWHEPDMHCYLYHELLRDKSYIFHDSVQGDISLVRREYPTNLFYDTSDKKRIYIPIKPTQRKKHGNYDIVIIQNPKETNNYGFNKISNAFELKYEAEKTGENTVNTMKNFFKNIYKDYRKLTDQENEVKNGHIMYFTKNEHTGFKTLKNIIDFLDQQKVGYTDIIDINLNTIRFSYIEINTDVKPVIIKNY